MYAQTNIQLYKQLQKNGYSGRELGCIRNAYEFAIRFSTCLYRPSGKTNIAHFVGTASILSSLRVPVEVVAAGLLHSIYKHGDFGSFKRGLSKTKRNTVRNAVGEEVEEYLARYAALEWNPKTIPIIRNKLHKLDSINRHVVLMRLADWLDDHLDRGILYCPNSEGRKQYTKLTGGVVIEMAEELGFPSLAAELEGIIKQTDLAEIAPELRCLSSQNCVFLIAPKSYRRPLLIALCQELHRGLQYFGRQHVRGPHYLRRRLGRGFRRIRLAMGVRER